MPRLTILPAARADLIEDRRLHCTRQPGARGLVRCRDRNEDDPDGGAARQLSGAGRVAQRTTISAAWALSDFLSGIFRRSANRPRTSWSAELDPPFQIVSPLMLPNPAFEIEILNKLQIMR